MQKEASAESEACETGKWPQLAGGGAAFKASTESEMSLDESADSESSRPLVAEVDHFRSLRAR
ncbi:MAG: hypothetical protein ICV60_07425 [Pyrinomonadaceae bacterium]|nr:hypothetical protein [Pyrinomonadaceae bacterium]